MNVWSILFLVAWDISQRNGTKTVQKRVVRWEDMRDCSLHLVGRSDEEASWIFQRKTTGESINIMCTSSQTEPLSENSCSWTQCQLFIQSIAYILKFFDDAESLRIHFSTSLGLSVKRLSNIFETAFIEINEMSHGLKSRPLERAYIQSCPCPWCSKVFWFAGQHNQMWTTFTNVLTFLYLTRNTKHRS